MKAAVLDRLGGTPRLADFPEPEARPGEQIIQVTAAAIKQLERAIAAGAHYSSPTELPIVLGIDGVGRLTDGTRVYFMVKRRPFGAMAEYAPADWTAPLPDGIDDLLAAAVVNPALGAWLPLVSRAHLARGENVLILGATGTSGRMAVIAARLLGASRVVACGRRAEVLARLDADATIDLTLPVDLLARRFAEEAAHGIGVIVDYVWGASAEAAIAALIRPDLAAAERDIRYVSVGAMGGPTIALPSAALRGARLEILGSGTGNFPAQPEMAAIVSEVLRHAAAGRLPLDVAGYPLADVASAWASDLSSNGRPVLMIR